MTTSFFAKALSANPHNTFGKGHKTRAVNGGGDAYFTRADVVQTCMTQLKAQLKRFRIAATKRLYLEPSAGAGAWLDALPKGVAYQAYDIKPSADGIEQANFYDVTVPDGCIVIGNPPFGFMAKEAVGFFNHAATGADVIAFIVPRTFKKQSIQNKLDTAFHLKFEQDLPAYAFEVDGVPHDVPCVFQIWRRQVKPRAIVKISIDNPWFEFTIPAAADFSVRRVGGQAGRVLNGTDHSKSSTYFIRCKQQPALVRKALERIDRSVVDDTAGVRSISKQELVAAFFSSLQKLL